MKEILNNIKFIFKYSKKTILFTWLFFFILSVSDKSTHTIFTNFLLSGVFTLVIIIIASVFKYSKLL